MREPLGPTYLQLVLRPPRGQLGQDRAQSLVTWPWSLRAKASAIGSGPGPRGAYEAVTGRASRGKEEASQGLFHYAALNEGLATLWLPPGTSGSTPSGGPEGSEGLGQGVLTALARQVLQQLEAQQAKVMDTAEPPAHKAEGGEGKQGERKLPCPALPCPVLPAEPKPRGSEKAETQIGAWYLAHE